MAITGATTLFVVSAMVVALHHVIAGGTQWWVKGMSFLAYVFFAI